ncbi:MAG: flagellar basal body-associated FliL family protein [Glycocaulis sp.]
MAEEAEDETGEEAESGEDGGKSGPDIKKLALFVGLPAIIVVLGLVAGALFLFGGGGDETDLAEEEGESLAGAAAAAEIESLPVYVFEDRLIVQIYAANGAPHLLSLELELEIADPAIAAVLDARMGRVLDGYAAFLRELSPDDLAGSAGLHRVRLELLRRTNLAIAPARVEAVLIKQMLVTQS